MKNTLTQLDILLVNHVSVTTLPETVPAFTAFTKMKNERSFLRRKRKRIPKIINLKDSEWG